MFRAFTHYNLQLNNVSHLVEVRGKVLGDTDGAQLTMMVRAGQQDGRQKSRRMLGYS